MYWKDTPDHLGELVQHCLSGCVFSSPWVTEPSEVSQAYLSNPYGVLSDFILCEDWKTSFSQAAWLLFPPPSPRWYQRREIPWIQFAP